MPYYNGECPRCSVRLWCHWHRDCRWRYEEGKDFEQHFCMSMIQPASQTEMNAIHILYREGYGQIPHMLYLSAEDLLDFRGVGPKVLSVIQGWQEAMLKNGWEPVDKWAAYRLQPLEE